MRLEDCCYSCGGCQRRTCRDDNPSPREDERICGECAFGAWVAEGWSA